MAVVASACSDSTAGEARPSGTSGLSQPTGTGTATEPTLPPRPRDITLDAVDPCTLWSGDQLTQLAMAPTPRRDTSTAGDAYCAYEATSLEAPNLSFAAYVVLDHDVTDSFLPEQGDELVDVDGFPAVRRAAPATGPQPCTVMVSVVEGQYLEIKLFYGSTEAHLSGERACELTVKAATFAMQTLQTQR